MTREQKLKSLLGSMSAKAITKRLPRMDNGLGEFLRKHKANKKDFKKINFLVR